jgi:hypothetical protein
MLRHAGVISSSAAAETPQSVVDLGFQYNLPLFPTVVYNSLPVFYSHYI